MVLSLKHLEKSASTLHSEIIHTNMSSGWQMWQDRSLVQTFSGAMTFQLTSEDANFSTCRMDAITTFSHHTTVDRWSDSLHGKPQNMMKYYLNIQAYSFPITRQRIGSMVLNIILRRLDHPLALGHVASILTGSNQLKLHLKTWRSKASYKRVSHHGRPHYTWFKSQMEIGDHAEITAAWMTLLHLTSTQFLIYLILLQTFMAAPSSASLTLSEATTKFQ